MDRFLAVTDKDERYAKRLCDYINEKKAVPFSAVNFKGAGEYLDFSKNHNVVIHIFDRETFEEYLSKERFCEGLLEENPETMDPAQELSDKKTVFLYKSMLLNGEEGYLKESFQGVYKYLSAEEILRKSMDIYSRSSGKLKYVDNFGKTKIIGVYSPVGRCGKTTFSLILGEMYAKKKKVLYLSPGEFSGFSAFTGRTEETDLSDVLYYLKENDLDFSKLKAFTYSMRGFDYIPPLKNPDDMAAAEPRDYVNLIESISDISDYEVIIVDMPAVFSCASELMELCDEIYMPYKEDFLSREKISAFDKYMEEAKRFKLMEKIRKVDIPNLRERSFVPGLIDDLIYSETGDFIREFVSEEPRR